MPSASETSRPEEPEAHRFAAACIATSHYLATHAGAAVLRDGGNAIDAAIAANLVLGVVAPYSCGIGGDCFAIIWDGGLHGYNGSGRAPAAATPDAVLARPCRDMPRFGPLAVTVPGAVDAWFALLERFGTRSFAELAGPAIAYASDGFPLTAAGAARIQAGRPADAGWGEWEAIYGRAAPGDTPGPAGPRPNAGDGGAPAGPTPSTGGRSGRRWPGMSCSSAGCSTPAISPLTRGSGWSRWRAATAI